MLRQAADFLRIAFHNIAYLSISCPAMSEEHSTCLSMQAQACLSRIKELATVESQFASQVGAFRQMQSSYAPNKGEHETDFAAQYDQAFAQLLTQRYVRH